MPLPRHCLTYASALAAVVHWLLPRPALAAEEVENLPDSAEQSEPEELPDAAEPGPDTVAEERVQPPELSRYVEAALPEGLELLEPVAVVLELSISAEGSVESARALASDVKPELAAAAEEAAKQFVFKPAMVGATPIAVVVEYTYWFAPEVKGDAKVEPEPAAPAPVAPTSSAPVPPASAPGSRTTDTEDVTVYEAVAEVEAPPREPTRRDLPKERLGKVPGARGDALRAIEVLPGVSRAPLGNNPIIRGAGGHESLAFVDGVAIPQLYHFGGLTSVVHPALLENVRLYPGNFSSRYGRATGGIVEASLRSPRSDGFHALVDVNLIDSSALAEAPLTDELALVAAVRRSNIDFVFESFVPEGTFNVVAAPLYWDYQVLAEYRPEPRAKLKLMLMGSKDELKLIFDEPNQEDLFLRGEVSGALEYHTLTLAYERQAASVRQSYQVSFGQDLMKQRVGPTEAELRTARVAARAEWGVDLADSMEWISGLDFTGSFLSGDYRGPAAPAAEGSSDDPDSTASMVVIDGMTMDQIRPAAYTEARWFVTPRWLLVPGLRLDFYEDLAAVTINPRLSSRYTLSDDWTLKAGLGSYSQPPVWFESLPSIGNPHVEPYHSLHSSLGVERRFGDALLLDSEAFYKHLYERVVATEGGVPPRFINDGEGRIYGLEASARLTPSDAVFGQLSYTLSRSERQDRDDPYRLFDYDQTHVLNATFATALGAGWEVGARFRWISGNPVTPVSGAIYDARSGAYQPRFGAHNSDRDSAYHQLDLRVDKRFRLGPASLNAYLELINAYAAENADGYSYSYDYSRKERALAQPFFPNLGLRGEL